MFHNKFGFKLDRTCSAACFEVGEGTARWASLGHIGASGLVGRDIGFLLALCSSFVLIVVVGRGDGGG